MAEEGRPSEDELIARYLAPVAGPGSLGLRDDAGLLSPSPGHDLVVTTDAVVAGIHYMAADPAGSVARKALGVNISDLVAKGAEPRGFLLTLALSADWTEEWLAAFCEGLAEGASSFRCPLLGGDTVRTAGPTLVSVAAFGEVPAGRMVSRTAAKAGDRLCVTGTIGDAALGLALRLERDSGWARGTALAHRAFLADRYLHPSPRLAAAALLRDGARAAMDVSDGLAGDLAKMMRASGTTAAVDISAIPLSSAAATLVAAEPKLIDRVLTGGDDYEVLCAVPEAGLADFLARADDAGVPAAVIGVVTEGQGLPVFRTADGSERRFERGSYSHF